MTQSSQSQLSRKVFARTAFLQSLAMILVLILLGFALRSGARDRYIDSAKHHLDNLALVLTKQIPKEISGDWCKKVSQDSGFWLSMISSIDGHLYCDSSYEPGTYEGVIDRPEVQNAIHSPDGRGSSIRISPDWGPTQGLFSTRYFKDRDLVLRVGLPLQPLEKDLKRFDRVFIGSMIIISLLLIAALQFTTRGVLFRSAELAVVSRERKMKEDFVATVSHEFRTPLTSIMGFAKTITNAVKADQRPNEEHLKIIEKDSKRLLAMVNDILDLSALDAGSLEIHSDRVFTSEIVDEVSKRLQVVWSHKGIKIVSELEAEEADADPDRLVQILTNLMSNCMKFCPDGSTIRVSCHREDHQTVWTVADNGPGLPRKVRDNLFKRFSKEKSKTGSGLGLAIVRGLVLAHGGEIHLDNTHRGTSFTFRLPFEGQIN